MLDPGAFTQAKQGPLWVRLWPLWICILVIGFGLYHYVPDAARIAVMRTR